MYKTSVKYMYIEDSLNKTNLNSKYIDFTAYKLTLGLMLHPLLNTVL